MDVFLLANDDQVLQGLWQDARHPQLLLQVPLRLCPKEQRGGHLRHWWNDPSGHEGPSRLPARPQEARPHRSGAGLCRWYISISLFVWQC